jgi:hypothetical protein
MILVIDATATDADGNTASASVAVSVTDPPELAPEPDPFRIQESMVRWRTPL